MPKQSTNNLVGSAGEYFVCAELCRRGYLALLTPKNNPLFDVVATSSDGSRTISIQVKTRSIHNKQGWKLNAAMESEDHPKGMFIVLVNLTESGLPDFYVYESNVLAKRIQTVYAEYMARPKRDGTPRKHVSFRWFDEASFTDEDKKRRNNWQSIVKALQTN